jgi:RNA 2',3'-cyclic 3'-phosphodiesterase
VEGDERLQDGDPRVRLFCALRLHLASVAQVAEWQAASLPAGRIVPPENLHVTLAFLGSRPATDVAAVASALRSAAPGAGGIVLRARGYRETRSVGMLELDDENGPARRLAERLQDLLESSGLYRREARPWLPHLTVVRFRDRPRLAPPVPELELAPSDAAVFMSRPCPGGVRYDAAEIVPLGG